MARLATFVGIVIVLSAVPGCGDASPADQLRDAAAWGDADRCAELIRSGVSVDTTDDRGLTPLGYAIYNQRPAAVKRLLDLGADVNHADQEGRTPLIYTAWAPFGHGRYSPSTMSVRNEIAEVLIGHGADVNHAQYYGATALHLAVLDQNPWLVRRLLVAGADVALRQHQGYTALDVARFPAYAPNDDVLAAFAPPKPGRTPAAK